ITNCNILHGKIKTFPNNTSGISFTVLSVRYLEKTSPWLLSSLNIAVTNVLTPILIVAFSSIYPQK
ncbi:MAG: hypothetical protein QS748_14850, partial [Candidatus Endonucleobacter bathymodioli]|nr:hypothetical protein [Candidatus Endonucleobacter bathymodioli]